MPRSARSIDPGTVYHVYDRGNRRDPIFECPDEYDLFVGLLGDCRRRTDTELLAFCLMPNHWHLLLRPRSAAGLRAFVSRLKQVHTGRYHAVRKTWGEGRLYQGRFKAKPLAEEPQILACCRYIERNALSAHLASRAEEWPWGSLWHRVQGNPEGLLDAIPVELPATWVELVNAETT